MMGTFLGLKVVFLGDRGAISSLSKTVARDEVVKDQGMLRMRSFRNIYIPTKFQGFIYCIFLVTLI